MNGLAPSSEGIHPAEGAIHAVDLVRCCDLAATDFLSLDPQKATEEEKYVSGMLLHLAVAAYMSSVPGILPSQFPVYPEEDGKSVAEVLNQACVERLSLVARGEAIPPIGSDAAEWRRQFRILYSSARYLGEKPTSLQEIATRYFNDHQTVWFEFPQGFLKRLRREA